MVRSFLSHSGTITAMFCRRSAILAHWTGNLTSPRPCQHSFYPWLSCNANCGNGGVRGLFQHWQNFLVPYLQQDVQFYADDVVDAAHALKLPAGAPRLCHQSLVNRNAPC